MENEREVLLEVNHLNVTYGSGKKAYEAVQDANFKIYKGETFGLVGESGSGKTTGCNHESEFYRQISGSYNRR